MLQEPDPPQSFVASERFVWIRDSRFSPSPQRPCSADVSRGRERRAAWPTAAESGPDTRATRSRPLAGGAARAVLSPGRCAQMRVRPRERVLPGGGTAMPAVEAFS